MSSFKPRPDLEAVVARMIAPRVQRVVDDLEGEIKNGAPPTKTWRTSGDERVRPEHRKADGQEVPDNLRFVLDSPLYDQAHYRVGPWQKLRRPRDPEASPGLTENCRCVSVSDPEGIARGVAGGPVKVEGATVRGRVTVRGPRVKDAEYGDADDPGTHFIRRALRKVAARWRARVG